MVVVVGVVVVVVVLMCVVCVCVCVFASMRLCVEGGRRQGAVGEEGGQGAGKGRDGRGVGVWVGEVGGVSDGCGGGGDGMVQTRGGGRRGWGGRHDGPDEGGDDGDAVVD